MAAYKFTLGLVYFTLVALTAVTSSPTHGKGSKGYNPGGGAVFVQEPTYVIAAQPVVQPVHYVEAVPTKYVKPKPVIVKPVVVKPVVIVKPVVVKPEVITVGGGGGGHGHGHGHGHGKKPHYG